MIEQEIISPNDPELRNLQNYLITQNNMTKILCSLCELKNIDRYLEVLESLEFLDKDDDSAVKTLMRLKRKLNRVPSYKVFLKTIHNDCDIEKIEDLYTEEELDDWFELLQKKNIEWKIYLKIKDFIKDFNNGVFNEEILNQMCDYNMDLHRHQNIIDCYDTLHEIYENKEVRQPIYTGIKGLDDNNITLAKAELSIIMGATGSFKTTFASNIAYNKIKEGLNVAYISLEIPKENMYFNFLSLHSTDEKFKMNIPHTEIKYSTLSNKQEEYFFNEVYSDFKNIKEHLIIIDEKDVGLNTFSSYTKLLAEIDRKFQNKTGKGLDILIVDHMQLLKNNTDLINDNPYIIVSKWVDYFRRNTTNFLNTGRTISTILVSQVNRKGYEESCKNYGSYKVTALADSVDVERNATNIFAISAETTQHSKAVVITTLKTRDKQKNMSQYHIDIFPEYYSFNYVPYKKMDDEYQVQEQSTNNTTELCLKGLLKTEDALDELLDSPIISFENNIL